MFIIDTRPRLSGGTQREAFDLGLGKRWRADTEGRLLCQEAPFSLWKEERSGRWNTWKEGRDPTELVESDALYGDEVVTGWHEDLVGLYNEPGTEASSQVAMICMGQVWEVKGLGRILILHTRLEKDELEVIVSSTRMRTIIPTTSLIERGEFVSGPVTIYDELLFVAEEEIRSVPEGMTEDRWKSLVSGAKESFFRNEDPETPYRFREAIAFLRWSVPYFRHTR